jgi:predicted small lipoprotein YifL
VSGVRVFIVVTVVVLALAGCGRRGALEAPPGALAGTPETLSPPAPGSGGPSGPRPFAGPGSAPVDAPAVAVVGDPVTNPVKKKTAKPTGSFPLDPLL